MDTYTPIKELRIPKRFSRFAIALHRVPRNRPGFHYTWKYYAHHLLTLKFYWKARKYNVLEITLYKR